MIRNVVPLRPATLSIAGRVLRTSSVYPVDARPFPAFAPAVGTPISLPPYLVSGGGGGGGEGPFELVIEGDTTGQPTWHRPLQNASLPPVALSFFADDVPYEATAFNVETGGTYTFYQTSTPAWDSYMFLYAGGFNPADPLNLVLIGNDEYPTDVPLDGVTGFTYDLTPGTVYYVVISGYDNESAGPYVVTISGPGRVWEGTEPGEGGGEDDTYVYPVTYKEPAVFVYAGDTISFDLLAPANNLVRAFDLYSVDFRHGGEILATQIGFSAAWQKQVQVAITGIDPVLGTLTYATSYR